MENTVSESKYTIEFILTQIANIQEQTGHIFEAFEKLAEIPVGQGPGDVAGQAKAQALGDVVKCRETTNQQMLSFYEKMYCDLQRKENVEIVKEAFFGLTDSISATLDFHAFDEDDQRVEAIRIIYSTISQKMTELIQALLK